MQTKLTEKYIERILKDLNIEKLSEREQEVSMQILTERFNKVILRTLLKRITVEQKQAILTTIQTNPEKLEEAVEELAVGLAGLKEAIELALSKEYEEMVSDLKT